MGGFDGVGDVGFESLDVAGLQDAPLAVDGEVGLAFDAVDSNRSGRGVDWDLAAVTQVQQEQLPARALGQYPSRFGLRGAEFLRKRNQLGHGDSPGGGR